MIDIGDAVGCCHNAALEGLGSLLAIMAKDSVHHFSREVQPFAVMFQILNHAHRLLAMLKKALRLLGRQPPVTCNDATQRSLAGMTERRVTQVMAQGNRLDEVFVESKASSY